MIARCINVHASRKNYLIDLDQLFLVLSDERLDLYVYKYL